MELEFDVKVAPMELRHTNEDETLLAMGNVIDRRLVQRFASGQGAHGSLPAPKDGGQPGIRTGRMINSIRVTIGERRGVKFAVITPTGKRPESENVAGKKSAARARTREIRATAAVALTFARLGGNNVDRYTRKTPTKSGQIFKLASFRVRTADTNAALAGILSVPPKDKRGQNGGRGVYRIFEGNEMYRNLATQEARRVARFVMDVKGPVG